MFMCIATTMADQITPSATVVEAIKSIHNNNELRFLNIVDMKAVSNFPRHSYSKEQLIKLFKEIKIDKIEFKDLKNQPDLVHMISPINIQFEIAEIKAKGNIKPRVTYRIIGIHPQSGKVENHEFSKVKPVVFDGKQYWYYKMLNEVNHENIDNVVELRKLCHCFR